jgi:hypothetical protein
MDCRQQHRRPGAASLSLDSLGERPCGRSRHEQSRREPPVTSRHQRGESRNRHGGGVATLHNEPCQWESNTGKVVDGAKETLLGWPYISLSHDRSR